MVGFIHYHVVAVLRAKRKVFERDPVGQRIAQRQRDEEQLEKAKLERDRLKDKDLH